MKGLCWMCYMFHIDLPGLLNSITAYPYFVGLWKSLENRWAEASKTKIIDCFQTPVGRKITNQNSSWGCLKWANPSRKLANPSVAYPNQKHGNPRIYFECSPHPTHPCIFLAWTTVLLLLRCLLRCVCLEWFVTFDFFVELCLCKKCVINQINHCYYSVHQVNYAQTDMARQMAKNSTLMASKPCFQWWK